HPVERLKVAASKQKGSMKLYTVLFLLPLCLTEATINKCRHKELDSCFCDNQFYDNKLMFVVNCTGLGFNNTDMLQKLPEETQMLIFTGNNISTLSDNVFGEIDYLNTLKIVDMSNNQIRDIKGKAFHHVSNVERLILNHNNISISSQYNNFHHPRVFSNFYNLRELHLTDAFVDNTDGTLANDLHDIFVNSDLKKLFKLHLEQNEIKNFRTKGSSQLYLGDNSIPSLNFDVLCLKKLTFLDLERNNITKFSQDDLGKLDKLAQPVRQENLVIKLEENPFRCDSAIKNLYNWLHKTNVQVRNLDHLECHQAKNGKKYIMNLKNLAEAKHAKISQALTVLLVILVFILLTLLSAYAYLKKDVVRGKLSPLLESMSRKVQYTTLESQNV
ncbi:hypothetical protein NQ318_014754, partial [Aromia moschata]